MNDLDRILFNQAVILKALAMLIVPGDERSSATTRIEIANELFLNSEKIRKYAERNKTKERG